MIGWLFSPRSWHLHCGVPTTSLEFWNPSWKGKRKEGNLNSPTTTITRASRSEQWAAIGKGEGGWTTFTYLKTLLHAKDFNFYHSKNCTKDYLLHKIGLFRCSEINRFLVAQIGEVIFSLRFLGLFILPVKVKNSSHSSRACPSLVTTKRWWEAPWFPCQFSLVMQTTVTPTHFNVVHDFTPFWLGLEPTCPVH